MLSLINVNVSYPLSSAIHDHRIKNETTDYDEVNKLYVSDNNSDHDESVEPVYIRDVLLSARLLHIKSEEHDASIDYPCYLKGT